MTAHYNQEVIAGLRARIDKIPGFESIKQRLKAEITFASDYAITHAEKKSISQKIFKSIRYVEKALHCSSDLQRVLNDLEEYLVSFGKIAKTYTMHYVGHSHIDINWMWGFRETVEVIYKTFSNIEHLMQRYKKFKFSESSAFHYKIVQEYFPELFNKIKMRIKQGRWEVLSSTWTEGDKNMVSGESLVRQIILAKKYIKKEIGLRYDDLFIAWEPDTFGHPVTYPQIMKKAGINFYYINRGAQKNRLFVWKSPDGSEVIVWNDAKYLMKNPPEMRNARYNRQVSPLDSLEVLRLEKSTGLRDLILVYGLGDHGSGPGDEQIKLIENLSEWPIFPKVRFSSVKTYYDIIRRHKKRLPIVESDLNYVFRGCYASTSRIKAANRDLENDVYLCETLATYLFFEYGIDIKDAIDQTWERLCFNQFHDILAGCGTEETYQYSMGVYQDAKAKLQAVKEKSLDQIARHLNTYGNGIPILVYNSLPWTRTDEVVITLYGTKKEKRCIYVVDDRNNTSVVQIINSLDAAKETLATRESPYNAKPIRLFFDIYYKHKFLDCCFIARDIPPCGFKLFWLTQSSDNKTIRSVTQSSGNSVSVRRLDSQYIIDNQFITVAIKCSSGNITSLFHKLMKLEFVPRRKELGVLSIAREIPHKDSAWEVGQTIYKEELCECKNIKLVQKGPVRVEVILEHYYGKSRIEQRIIVHSHVPMIEYISTVHWREIGDSTIGVPSLEVAFPIASHKVKTTYDIPYGVREIKLDSKPVPVLNWAHISDAHLGYGITVCNDSSYSYKSCGNELVLTLLRSSYEPNPVPEIGEYAFRYALFPNGPNWTPSMSNESNRKFNQLLLATRIDIHKYNKEQSFSLLSIEPKNVSLSTVKVAEDKDRMIIRVAEIDGINCKMVLRMAYKIQDAQEVDLLERPIQKRGNNIVISENMLEVRINKYEVKTISVRFAL